MIYSCSLATRDADDCEPKREGGNQWTKEMSVADQNMAKWTRVGLGWPGGGWWLSCGSQAPNDRVAYRRQSARPGSAGGAFDDVAPATYFCYSKSSVDIQYIRLDVGMLVVVQAW